MSASKSRKKLQLRSANGKAFSVGLGSRPGSVAGSDREIWVSLGEGLEASVLASSSGVWSVVSSKGSFEVQIGGVGASTGDGSGNEEVEARIGGSAFRISAADARAGETKRKPATNAEVRAPMPGKVVKVLATEGEAVEAGQGILLFEAMKMQNEIRSPGSGVLRRLSVQEGQTVEAREPLFQVSPK